jgi:hypothetical protein
MRTLSSRRSRSRSRSRFGFEFRFRSFSEPSPSLSYLVLTGGRLAILVEGHHNHGGAIALDKLRLADELLLANLERDGVEEALALQALRG